jgi:hypothetical protein
VAGGKGRRVKTFKALLPVNSQSEVLYINKEDVVLLGKGDGALWMLEADIPHRFL